MGLYTRFFVRGAFAPAVRSRNGSCAGINRRLWRLLVEGRRRRVPGGGCVRYFVICGGAGMVPVETLPAS